MHISCSGDLGILDVMFSLSESETSLTTGVQAALLINTRITRNILFLEYGSIAPSPGVLISL